MKQALLLWFNQQSGKGIPLSGSIIQEKAKILAELFGEDYKDLSASLRWLEIGKSQFGVKVGFKQ